MNEFLSEINLNEYREMLALLASARNEFFHYGQGYDDLMDEMMGSPAAVLRQLIERLRITEAGAVWKR